MRTFARTSSIGASAPPPPRVSQPVPNPAPTPKIFSGMFARRPIAMNVGANGQTERVAGELVSGTYFQVLGVGAAVGRVIVPDDDKVRGDGYVAVLSYDYWRNRFGADPKIVGQQLMINGYPFTVVGVSQAGFDGLDIGSVASVQRPGDAQGANDAELGRHGQPPDPLGQRLRAAEAGRDARAGARDHPAVLPRPARAGSAGVVLQQHHAVHARTVPEGTGRASASGAGQVADPPAARSPA